MTDTITLDLNFQGRPNAIAAYLIPHRTGAVLIECGPASTFEQLQEGLRKHGFTASQVTDVLVTHIHLDHAGASGWLAAQGARVHVHPKGAPHLVNPEKLLASASRIYGDQMQRLWGEFRPVPVENIVEIADGERLTVEDLTFEVVNTPGHAEHHYAFVLDDLCFSGDIGGVRLPGKFHIRLPMPPPELNLVKWRASAARLAGLPVRRVAPTHFGIFPDAREHFELLLSVVDETNRWVEEIMASNPTQDELNQRFQDWTRQVSARNGIAAEMTNIFELANPSWMSAPGIWRYWHKTRLDSAAS